MYIHPEGEQIYLHVFRNQWNEYKVYPGIISFFVYIFTIFKQGFNIYQTSDFKVIKMVIINFKTPIDTNRLCFQVGTDKTTSNLFKSSLHARLNQRFINDYLTLHSVF